MVDDEDVDRVSALKWHALESRPPGTWYAKSGTGIIMHQFILGITSQVDHRDFDGLNNQKSNLREATGSQQQSYRRVYPHSSKFKGVILPRGRRRWKATIVKDHKHINLGSFSKEKDAALAYDAAALALFGEFALTNQQQGLL